MKQSKPNSYSLQGSTVGLSEDPLGGIFIPLFPFLLSSNQFLRNERPNTGNMFQQASDFFKPTQPYSCIPSDQSCLRARAHAQVVRDFFKQRRVFRSQKRTQCCSSNREKVKRSSWRKRMRMEQKPVASVPCIQGTYLNSN